MRGVPEKNLGVCKAGIAKLLKQPLGNRNHIFKIESRKSGIENRKAKIGGRLINSLTKIGNRKSKFFSESPNQTISFPRGIFFDSHSCLLLRAKYVFFTRFGELLLTFQNMTLSFFHLKVQVSDKSRRTVEKWFRDLSELSVNKKEQLKRVFEGHQ